MSVSIVDRNIPDPGATRFVRERVQITVMAGTYVAMKQIMRAVKAACDAKFPTVSGIGHVTAHLDMTGPDFMDEEASLYLGTQDIATTYSVTR